MSTPTLQTPLNLDDLAALRLFASTGDPRAFEAIVHRYQGMVLAACERTTRSRADAEDAAQETFLKLARGAGAIRSNAAAWLHACAIRTSIDLMRKRGTSTRAEHAASVSDASDENVPGWRELKPLLDQALAELSESDRELIVVRFLVGRLEIDMAREADCSPGTMHRRIDRALDKLRSRIASAGLAIGGAAGLSAALAAASSQSPAPALTRSLMEIGLANITTPASAALSGKAQGGTLLIVGASTLALASVIAGITGFGMFGGDPAPATTATTTPTVMRAERATATESAQRLVEGTIDDRPHSTLECDGSTLRVATSADDGGPGMDVMTINIESASGKAKNAKVTMRFVSLRPASDKPSGLQEFVGQTWTGECRIVGDRVDLVLNDPKTPERQLRWGGRRTSTTVAEPAKPASVKPPLPELVGSWREVPDWSLFMGKDEITVKSGNYEVMRLRIEEWTPVDEHAKVKVFAARYMNAELIGVRFCMLVRKTTDGYTLALPNSPTAKLNEFPASVEPTPGSRIAVLRFSKEGK
ncbi:MAG: RNA polymerase sigma factor [Phycisphaerales bacterium]|nr:RNA polymerase sigma factor [Phycisphaerales bacterium]